MELLEYKFYGEDVNLQEKHATDKRMNSHFKRKTIRTNPSLYPFPIYVVSTLQMQSEWKRK